MTCPRCQHENPDNAQLLPPLRRSGSRVRSISGFGWLGRARAVIHEPTMKTCFVGPG